MKARFEAPIFSFNSGFLIAKRLFYPGDSFFVPPVPVEILALPVSAPWMRIEEAIEYAKDIKPKIVFPVHDGMLKPEYRGSSRTLPHKLLTPVGVEFRDAVEGSVLEF
ncbi:MAG TPA: MBL fold metallo-hydrolase [Candidatus Paceibacterota bacterium]